MLKNWSFTMREYFWRDNEKRTKPSVTIDRPGKFGPEEVLTLVSEFWPCVFIYNLYSFLKFQLIGCFQTILAFGNWF